MSVSAIGRGKNLAVVTARGGEQILGELPSDTLDWSRVRNDSSTCNITVPVTKIDDRCCDLLGGLHTWGHEIVVYRDGERSWEGPITNIREGSLGVSIVANDVMAYTKKRITRGVFDAVPTTAVNSIAADLTTAFSLAGDDPNVLAYVNNMAPGTGPTTSRDVEAYSSYYFDTIGQMVEAGGNYSVIGRSIIIWPNGYAPGVLEDFYPDLHLTSEVEVVEDGMNLCTDALVIGDDGILGWSTVAPQGVGDPFYGYLESLTTLEDIYTNAGAIAAANSIRTEAYPARTLVVIPDGSTLSCDAPYGVGQLVAGVQISVRHRTVCRKVDQLMTLQSVTVRQDAEGEQVQVTLADFAVAS